MQSSVCFFITMQIYEKPAWKCVHLSVKSDLWDGTEGTSGFSRRTRNGSGVGSVFLNDQRKHTLPNKRIDKGKIVPPIYKN